MQTTHIRFFCSVTASLFLLTSPVSAQRAPGLGYVYPPVGKPGTTIEVRLGGYDWTPDMQYFVLDRRVRLEAAGPPSDLFLPPPPFWFGSKSRLTALPLPREHPARLTIPADVPPGPIYFQAANANGGSNVGVFLVSNDIEILEDENRQGPQTLPALPVNVSGRLLKNEEIDRYRFATPKAGPITCALQARQLGSKFHGILAVEEVGGRLVADAADTEGTDVALTFQARAGAEYIVSVRDVDFAGDRSFVYRLRLNPGPRIVAALPTVGHRGETREVEFVGFGVATGAAKLESVKRSVTFPAAAGANSFLYRLETPFGTATFPLFVSDLLETVDPPRTSADPRKLQTGAAVTGVLDKVGAEHRYVWTAKKGEVWAFSLEARRFGSPLDVALAILDADGKELVRNDDLPGTTDAGLTFTAPADAAYHVLVSDVAGRSGSRAAVYRLVVQAATPDFSLETPLQRVPLHVGTKGTLTVKTARTGGFKGPIKLTVTGLPTGVTVPADLVIPADKNELAIPLQSAADAPATATLVTVSGVARPGTQPLTRTAQAPITSDLTARRPEDSHTADVLFISTLKPRFKGGPAEKDTVRKVHRGATHPAEVVLERLEGYNGPIMLQMAAQQSYQVQGITGGNVVVPAGEVRAFYPCFMPEWLETSRTSRMGIIGVVQVADPRGTVRHQVIQLEGFVTMSLEGALLKVSNDVHDLRVPAGESFTLPIKISRSPTLTEALRLELRLPEELAGCFTAETITLPSDKNEATVRITATGRRVTGDHILTIRATVLQNGNLPVVAETAVAVEIGNGGSPK